MAHISATADGSRSVPPQPPEDPPISLESPMDAVVFAPTSAAAQEASETKKSAFEQLASEAVRRAGIRFDTLIVHADRVVVQANACVIPVTTHDKVITTKDQRGVDVPRKTPLLLGSRHLIVKHVDLNATSVPFRDAAHRDRTRASFACECAVYRERSRAPGARGGDGGSWATPFVYLVEGDAEADAFTVVMDDAARPRPGALQKRREEKALSKMRLERSRAPAAAVAAVSVGAPTGSATTATTNQTAGVMLHHNEAALAKKGDTAVSDCLRLSERQSPTLPGTCDFFRARAAVQWLASFHAHWWRGLPDSPPIPRDLWPRGGYWTLEKRALDLPDMDATWRGLLRALDADDAECAATAAALRRACGENFGARLSRAGPALSRAALRAEWGTPNMENGGATLVHGDFKAANIMFRRVARPKRSPEDPEDDEGAEPSATEVEAAAPTVIDWQWTGPGGAAHDLAYFLTTSLSTDALERVDDLVSAYLARLANDLSARGDAGRAAAAEYDEARLRRDLAVHYADYARYLAGDVWKTLTPESMRRDYGKTNMGAHRRSRAHLLFVATRGAAGLEACERGEPGDEKDVDPDAPPPRADADVPPLRRGPVSRLVAELLGVCVALADDAGDIVRFVAEGGHMGAVKDKSGDGADKKDGADARDEEARTGAKKRAKPTTGTRKKNDDGARDKKGFALDPQTQADRRSERLICDTLRRAFGGVVTVVGEEASEGALAAKGAANADGSVDEDDAALEMSDETLARAADFVRDWELLLPPELEIGPAAEARLVEAARLAEEKGLEAAGDEAEGELSGMKVNKKPAKPALFSHPACAESDVTVWVDPLDGTREFVEGPEHWGAVTVLIGVAVKGVPVAGVIHQPFVGIDGKPPASMTAALAARAAAKAALAAEGWKPKRKNKNPEDDLETFPTGSFGKGRTLWGVPGLGVFSNPGREPHRAMPVMKPKPADFKNLRVATTRSHPSPFVEGAVYKLYPSVVHRAGGAGGKVAMMLDGLVDTWVFPAKGTKRWDTCAGEALLCANRGGWLVRGSNGAAYEYGAAIAEWPANVDGVIAGADKELYPWMVRKWPWLNYAGGFRVGPRDAGLE